MLIAPAAAVVNPVAGGGRGTSRWRRVGRHLERTGHHVDTFMTDGPGHATTLTCELIERGYRTVIAVGGDGTVHEAINGLADSGSNRSRVLFATLPSGTGMDFARSAGLPRGERSFVEHLLHAPERRIDLGLATFAGSRVFVNFAEIGLGSAVIAREPQYSRHWPGRLAYVLAAIDAGLREPLVRGRILVGGSTVYEGAVTSVVIANSRFFGGGMKIAPQAKSDDGLLDVVALTDFSRSELVTQAWKIYPGLHVGHHKVLWLRTTELAVETDGVPQLDLDGELYTGAPYSFSVLPGELRLAI